MSLREVTIKNAIAAQAPGHRQEALPEHCNASVVGISTESGRASFIELDGIAFSYGAFTLGPISTRLGPERIGLVGPNGAGKTTLMSLIAGILPGTDGRILMDGNVLSDADRRLCFAYSGDGTVWHDALTIEDYLRLMRAAYPNWDRAREKQLMQRFSLRYDMMPARCSSGNKAKLSLVFALSRNASMLLLDEPWNALDPIGRSELTEELLQVTAQSGIGILVSSHELAQIESLCERLLFIEDGRIAADGSAVELARANGLHQHAPMLDVYKSIVRK